MAARARTSRRAAQVRNAAIGQGHVVEYGVDYDEREVGVLCADHECKPTCLTVQLSQDMTTPYSPLVKPTLYKFQREICQTQSKEEYVMYKAPCGRRLRDMGEVHQYLRMTECDELNVDNFTFDTSTKCLNVFSIDYEWCPMKMVDVSQGIEAIPIESINQYDATQPPPFTYTADRKPTEGVNMALDVNFLCGCDCIDDCADKSKCACWQLTLDGAKHVEPEIPISEIGYEYKRLNADVQTGIYECNSQCKCNRNRCLNRVVQHPLQWRLQLFKTQQCGWGVRCLNDIPKGAFICCYVGNILTSAAAEQSDSVYLADLNFIEVAEKLKEGYESGVVDNEHDDGKESHFRKLIGPNEAVYVLDGEKVGNIAKFFNHSCAPNVFVQNVFVDTHDLRFPWAALFASENIKAGTELRWDYGYVKGSVPGKKLYCKCGAMNCVGRLY